VKKQITLLTLLFGLLTSSLASASLVEINDGFYDIYDPLNDYQVNAVVGGTEIFTFGFGFINDNHGFFTTISLPNDFIGELEWLVSRGPDGTGLTFGGGGLLAGESVIVEMGGVPNSSPTSPWVGYISMQALDMPALSDVPVNSPVPVPAAVWLFGSGLIGLVGMSSRKKA
jgi:hypothetical protein